MSSHRPVSASLCSNSAYRQTQMGFLAPTAAFRTAGLASPCPQTRPSPDQTLFTFDGGRSLTFAEGVRSTLVLGGTGSGKTTSVILPMLDALLRRGFGGIILDVKGNLGAQTRELAKACGRLDDVVEFGSSSDACATNLLAGMKQHEIADFFQMLAVDGVEHDPNVSWHGKGGSLAADVAQVLSALSQVEPDCHFSRQFAPTLKAVFAALSNQAFAVNLWKFYCQEPAITMRISQSILWKPKLFTMRSMPNAFMFFCLKIVGLLEKILALCSTKKPGCSRAFLSGLRASR